MQGVLTALFHAKTSKIFAHFQGVMVPGWNTVLSSGWHNLKGTERFICELHNGSASCATALLVENGRVA